MVITHKSMLLEKKKKAVNFQTALHFPEEISIAKMLLCIYIKLWLILF